ncbi:MAG: hydrogenase nickel incorporation protein HypB, partial [Oscillospiraceae bacterium]|nr:hydrogenase nickel incorporation protein HypB [Oscillospiraceae bacterium]
MKVIELRRTVTDSNDRDAEALRKELKARGIFLINLMSAAGSGKTTLLSRTITDLAGKTAIGVMEADIASDVDAVKIGRLGAQSIQMHTDGMCHVDAGMARAGIEAMEDLKAEIVFLENVGNLICPAEFDTGAHRKVMILSVPEGDDKPLKYPLMFRESDALVITKTDALPYFDFDL